MTFVRPGDLKVRKMYDTQTPIFLLCLEGVISDPTYFFVKYVLGYSKLAQYPRLYLLRVQERTKGYFRVDRPLPRNDIL